MPPPNTCAIDPSPPRWRVLVVDDEPNNLQLLRQLLKDRYQLAFAKSGREALRRVEELRPDLVLLDIMMPEMDGYEVCRRLKADPATRAIPVIFVTALHEVQDEKKGFDLGAVDYINKPISGPVVQARVRTHLALYDQQRACEARVRERTAELNQTRLQVVQRLGRAAEYKDNETGLHVVRMSHYSRLLAARLGWDEDACELLLHAAPMHDVGKIGIPDQVLRKQSALTVEEWVIMQQHPRIGADIIGQAACPLLQMAASIALSHHEKWDGSGYPLNLRGDRIPIEGRVVAVADVFDALTTARPYKHAWPVEEAVAYLRDQAGRHFDPELVRLFLEVLPHVLQVKETWAER